jgi:hypothetical protein
MDRPEVHHHLGAGVLYQHPLIRYDVCDCNALIHGLAEGSFLLKGLEKQETFFLGGTTYTVLEQKTESRRVEVGPSDAPIIYRFQTPYLALNQDNFLKWEHSDRFGQRRLLERIVIGNLLSMAKAINLDVTEHLEAEVDLRPDGWFEVKPGVTLLGFRGAIQVNFLLPNRWGIGKSSARGFGTLATEEE